MATKRYTRSRGRLGSTRIMSWFDIVPSRVALTAGGGTILASLTAAELARRPFTIVRTHLRAHIASDQKLIDEFQMVALGFAVVSDQANAIGVSAVPTPVTDAASDLWYLHQYLTAEFIATTAVAIDANAGTWMNIDSKAMRKVDDSEDVVFVAELASAIAAGTLLSTAGRLLIKEH